jgi:hypothetical protein
MIGKSSNEMKSNIIRSIPILLVVFLMDKTLIIYLYLGDIWVLSIILTKMDNYRIC